MAIANLDDATRTGYIQALGSNTPGADLASRAMLVDLTISKWGNSRQDKQAGNIVAQTYSSDAKLGHYRKSLINPRHVEPLNKKLGEIYLEHRRRTLPWLDTGARILSAAGYLDYTSYLRGAQVELDTLLTDFEASYQSYVLEAQASITGLGGLFDPTLYPAPSEVRGLYGVSYRIAPLPDAGDFRVELADSEAERIRQSIAQGAESAVNLAVRDVYARVESTVGKMAEKLASYTGGKEGAFRDSLVENIRELADVLPSLNITNDPALDAITDRIKRELCPVDPDALRKDDLTREETAKAAQSILDQMSSFFA